MKTINISGKTYPCRPTMGAIIKFKQDTGKEVEAMSSVEDSIRYLYHCTASACRADEEDFKLSFEDFADRMEVDEFKRWADENKAEKPSDSKEQEKPGKK